MYPDLTFHLNIFFLCSRDLETYKHLYSFYNKFYGFFPQMTEHYWTPQSNVSNETSTNKTFQRTISAQVKSSASQQDIQQRGGFRPAQLTFLIHGTGLNVLLRVRLICVCVCVLTSAGYPGLCHSTVKWERAVRQQQRLRRQPGEWERRPQPPTGSCCQKACKLLHTAGLWNDSCGSSSSRSQKKNNGAKHNLTGFCREL